MRNTTAIDARAERPRECLLEWFGWEKERLGSKTVAHTDMAWALRRSASWVRKVIAKSPEVTIGWEVGWLIIDHWERARKKFREAKENEEAKTRAMENEVDYLAGVLGMATGAAEEDCNTADSRRVASGSESKSGEMQ